MGGRVLVRGSVRSEEQLQVRTWRLGPSFTRVPLSVSSRSRLAAPSRASGELLGQPRVLPAPPSHPPSCCPSSAPRGREASRTSRHVAPSRPVPDSRRVRQPHQRWAHGQRGHVPLGQSQPWGLTLPQTTAGLNRAPSTPTPELGGPEGVGPDAGAGGALGGPVPEEGLPRRSLSGLCLVPVPLPPGSSRSPGSAGAVNTGGGGRAGSRPL